MEYRQLGRSGLRVSALALGTTAALGGGNRLAGSGDTDLSAARRRIDLCLDAGINLIDTADNQSGGHGEEILGKALAGERRERVLLASKVRTTTGGGPDDRGLSRRHIIAECEASLRRLRTDHIDLYQLHEWDGQTPLDETLEAFDTLQRAGKIRYFGCANFSAWHLMKALGISEREGYARFVSQQIHYTLQAREAEYEMVPVAIDQGVGILVWNPLAGGLLSGEYRRGRDRPEYAQPLTDWNEPPVYDEDKLYDVVEVLVAIGEGRGVSAGQIALAWLLGRPGVASVEIDALTEQRLADNLAADELTLSIEERRQLDVASAPPLLYPYWHQVETAADRLSPADVTLLGRYTAPPLNNRNRHVARIDAVLTGSREPALLPAIRERAAKAPVHVLDVGCGEGRSLLELAWEVRAEPVRLTGIDRIPDAAGPAAVMRRYAIGNAAEIELPEIRGTTLGVPERFARLTGQPVGIEFPDASFDVIYSVAVIRLLGDKAQIVQECCRLLKPGGVALLDVDDELHAMPEGPADLTAIADSPSRFVIVDDGHFVDPLRHLQAVAGQDFTFTVSNPTRLALRIDKHGEGALDLGLEYDYEHNVPRDLLPYGAATARLSGIRAVYRVTGSARSERLR